MSSNLPKNQRNLSRISALAKNKGTLHHQLEDYIFDSLTLLFWFKLFLEAKAEILEKNSLVFWNEILKLSDLYIKPNPESTNLDLFSLNLQGFFDLPLKCQYHCLFSLKNKLIFTSFKINNFISWKSQDS